MHREREEHFAMGLFACGYPKGPEAALELGSLNSLSARSGRRSWSACG
jgi:hypothetical protein